MSAERHGHGHWIDVKKRKFKKRKSFWKIQKDFFLFLEQKINVERVEQILDELGPKGIPDDQHPSF